MAQPKAAGPIIYYRDPSSKPFYSLTPKRTDGGQPYVAIHASEDVSFNLAEAKVDRPSPDRKVKFYRNPMGSPDTSPTPKKDSMGMDYIPVYEGEDSDDNSVKVSPGKIQRTGVDTVTVGKHAITRTIKAPGVVQLDERRITVIAPRFDGYVVSAGAPTSGTHVKQGDMLATVFGQEILNQAARLLVEQNSGGVRGDERRHRGRRPLEALSVRHAAWRTSVCLRTLSMRSSASATCQIPSSFARPSMAWFLSAISSTDKASGPATWRSGSPTIR